MAVAEMARAGCIVWVARGGGQMEIVGREPILMYGSEDEAVEKIITTLGDPIEQQRLRMGLMTADRFSTHHFVQQVQEIVAGFSE